MACERLKRDKYKILYAFLIKFLASKLNFLLLKPIEFIPEYFKGSPLAKIKGGTSCKIIYFSMAS